MLVLGQNMGENKMDYYLKRRATYTDNIRPNGTLDARLDLEVRSLATPGSDLARYVGGSRRHIDLPEGVARTYMSVMVPAQATLKQVLFNGAPTTDFRNRLELGRRLFATTIDVAPAETHTVTYIYMRFRRCSTPTGTGFSSKTRRRPGPTSSRWTSRFRPSAVIGLREGFGRGASLDWSGPLTSEKELRAEVDVPWYARLLAKISSLLRRPAVTLDS